MLLLEQPQDHVKIIQSGRHVEVNTPTLEMICELPLGCDVQGHGCQAHFHRHPIQCTLSPYDIMRDAFIGINTMPSEHTRRFLTQYDENSWQVRLGRTRINLYTNEVRDICSCMDAIGQRYAQALAHATNQFDAWRYPQAVARGKTGVRLVAIHIRIWHLLQQFAHEFSASKGETIWHCFGTTHGGEAITIQRPEGPAQATIWALPHETYSLGDYLPLLYEYPDSELAATAEQTYFHEPRHYMSGAWTATKMEQWITNVLLPQVLSHYQVYQNAPWTTLSGLRYQVAEALAPDVFAHYREGSTAVCSATIHSGDEERTPLEQIDRPQQFIPYVEDIHQWLATYPVSRLKAEVLRPYYAIIADFAKSARPQVAGLYALRNMLDEMEQSTSREPRMNGWRLVTSSFEALSASLVQQVSRVNTIQYEYAMCADLLTLAFLHTLEHGRNQETKELLQLTKKALMPLWQQARFDERYVLKSAPM